MVILTILAIIYSPPVFAQKSYCWPKKDCEKANGIWVVTAESKDQNSPTGGCQQSPVQYAFCYPKEEAVNLQVPIGTLNKASSLTQYIPAVYNYLVAIVSIVAIVMIMAGGLRYLTAGGNPSAITSAKETILGAVIGLFLTFGSYTILQTINPALIKMELPRIKMVTPASLSPWCPNTDEFSGKFKCGTTYTKASTPSLPVSAGKSCVGSFCAEAGMGCFRAGDLAGLTDAEAQQAKTIIPTLPSYLCSFKAVGDFCLKARNILDDYCKKLSYTECKSMEWSSVSLAAKQPIEQVLGISSIGGSICQFEGALSIGTCKAALTTVGSICHKLTQKYKTEKEFQDAIGTAGTAGTK